MFASLNFMYSPSPLSCGKAVRDPAEKATDFCIAWAGHEGNCQESQSAEASAWLLRIYRDELCSTPYAPGSDGDVWARTAHVGVTLDPELLDAYRAHSDDLAQRGILDHTLDTLVLDGMTVEEAMRECLRRAGTWPKEGA